MTCPRERNHTHQITPHVARSATQSHKLRKRVEVRRGRQNGSEERKAMHPERKGQDGDGEEGDRSRSTVDRDRRE